MRGINVYVGERDLKDNGCAAEVKPGVWEVARPLGFSSLSHRIKWAWRVFMERADVVTWTNQ